MYQSFRETCTLDTRLVMIVDNNDPMLSRYYTCLNGFGQVVSVNPGRRGMVAALQSGLDDRDFRASFGYSVGFMGDDHRPRTVGWDKSYIDSLRELGSGFVYGNDLFQRERIPTQIAMTTDVVDALGYMCPPEFDHLCVDVVWKDWGQAIDRIRYLPDVVVEHVHYLAGKTRIDAGYSAVNSSAMASHDSAAYAEYKTNGRFDEDVEKLRNLL